MSQRGHWDHTNILEVVETKDEEISSKLEWTTGSREIE